MLYMLFWNNSITIL